ncbi:hypothetical protein ABEH28_23415 [Pseudomonas sp. Ps21-P2]|uniref:hypothetical protein n=1 Tax=Pseudomonas sp. Ps21-P2 TaxID=3080331 RepID=UPI00320A3063
MFSVGDAVGEFLTEEEKKAFDPLTLPQIVNEYIGCGFLDLLHAILFKRQIKSYIRRNMTPEGLQYVDPPFGQDTSFAEDYFEGDLYVFLTTVSALLDGEIKIRRKRLFGF